MSQVVLLSCFQTPLCVLIRSSCHEQGRQASTIFATREGLVWLLSARKLFSCTGVGRFKEFLLGELPRDEACRLSFIDSLYEQMCSPFRGSLHISVVLVAVRSLRTKWRAEGLPSVSFLFWRGQISCSSTGIPPPSCASTWAHLSAPWCDSSSAQQRVLSSFVHFAREWARRCSAVFSPMRCVSHLLPVVFSTQLYADDLVTAAECKHDLQGGGSDLVWVRPIPQSWCSCRAIALLAMSPSAVPRCRWFANTLSSAVEAR